MFFDDIFQAFHFRLTMTVLIHVGPKHKHHALMHDNEIPLYFFVCDKLQICPSEKLRTCFVAQAVIVRCHSPAVSASFCYHGSLFRKTTSHIRHCQYVDFLFSQNHYMYVHYYVCIILGVLI